MAHLQTHFTVKSSQFDSIAEKLVAVSHDSLTAVANHLEHEGSITQLSDEQKNVMNLLKQVNKIAAKIPGSQASNIHCRNTIRSYTGVFLYSNFIFHCKPQCCT
jgi:DNA-binding ferritin-like protein